ncbi:MAG: hydrogenase maturation nickel metallochaperone HypA [Oscillospiraceae bacterium]|jgi:hydrogenase nickel incorporation protein HypA/HybF
MHELGIVFHVIKSVEEIGAENGLTKVSSVTLEIGEVSGIVPEYLTDCWKWAVKKSALLDGSELRIEQIDAVTFCEGCGKTYPTVQYAKICPYCGSDQTWLQTGNEVNLKEIEAC